MAAWIWVLIPLAAILMGGFKEWLKFKAKQEKLGTSTHELEATVERLTEALEASEAEREAVERRLQNLETIVTSQAWDALAEDDGRLALPEQPPREEPSEAEKTEQLARRVQR